jgi:hypothetical protein
MNVCPLGKLIDPIEFRKYIEVAETMPVVSHKYGTPQIVPDIPCWMQYSKEGGIDGSISFSRHTMTHPVLSNMVKDVINVLTPIFNGITPNPARVHIIRTFGSITKHRDEAGRMCCINIGVLNSSSAITRMCNDNSDLFDNNYKDYCVEEGYGYLINTNALHSVEGAQTLRYLITYGFGERYSDIVSRLNVPA